MPHQANADRAQRYRNDGLLHPLNRVIVLPFALYAPRPNVLRGLQTLGEAEIAGDDPEEAVEEAAPVFTRRVRGFLGRAKQQVCEHICQHTMGRVAVRGLRRGGGACSSAHLVELNPRGG